MTNSRSYNQMLIKRLKEPFDIPWSECSPYPVVGGYEREGQAMWLAQDWQKRLWGSMWTWQYVMGMKPWKCQDYQPANAGRDAQVASLVRGVICDHEFCLAWSRLFRRFRALEKLLSPESAAAMVATKQLRYQELAHELRRRFGFLDDPNIDPSATASESLPRAS